MWWKEPCAKGPKLWLELQLSLSSYVSLALNLVSLLLSGTSIYLSCLHVSAVMSKCETLNDTKLPNARDDCCFLLFLPLPRQMLPVNSAKGLMVLKSGG